MKYFGFLKRFVPFIVALGIGLFIASFFVTLSAPKVEIRSNWKHKKHSRLHRENRRLKRENCRLKKESRKKRRRVITIERRLNVPPPPPQPVKPIAPEAPVN